MEPPLSACLMIMFLSLASCLIASFSPSVIFCFGVLLLRFFGKF